MVVLPPALALDGASGQPRWTGAPLVESRQQFMPRLLDPGDSRRGALLLAQGLGTTVCRWRHADPGGWLDRVAAGRAATAWRCCGAIRAGRPLPWVRRLTGALSPTNFFASGGLALVNVVLPLWIVWRVNGETAVLPHPGADGAAAGSRDSADDVFDAGALDAERSGSVAVFGDEDLSGRNTGGSSGCVFYGCDGCECGPAAVEGSDRAGGGYDDHGRGGCGRVDLAGSEVDGGDRALWVGGVGAGDVAGGVLRGGVVGGADGIVGGYGWVRRRGFGAVVAK